MVSHGRRPEIYAHRELLESFSHEVAMNSASPAPGQPFDLLRRFGAASLAVISAIAVGNGVLLTNFVTEHMLDREAHVTMDFILNVLSADVSAGFLTDPGNADLAKRFEGSTLHFTSMPDVQRINVYSRDRKVLWSTDRQLIGQKFDKNDELEKALGGELVVEGGSITDTLRSKPEHVGLSADSDFFVETYIPIRIPGQPGVLGAFELYKAPVALTAAIREGHRLIWLTALLGGLLLYFTLYWIVRSADRKIKDQHDRLLKAETLAAVGELAFSVAHNIRNPLSSIRSSAELALASSGSPTGEQARDIMAGVDRIEEWLRDLVSLAHVGSAPRTPVDCTAVLRHCFDKFSAEFRKSGIAGEITEAAPGTTVNADRALLGHVLHILVANSVEATGPGGSVTGRVARTGDMVEIRVADTGRGIPPEHMDRLFSLFFTTKPRGLGMGLTLARSAVERFGGSIQVASTTGAGTEFTIKLPAA
jgi:two-component system sensor histidine kinase HydH